MDCLFKKCLVRLLSMNKSPNIKFLSQWEYMNPNYRSSMEDVSIVNYSLRDNRNISLIALLDGHGGMEFSLKETRRLCHSFLRLNSSGRKSV